MARVMRIASGKKAPAAGMRTGRRRMPSFAPFFCGVCALVLLLPFAGGAGRAAPSGPPSETWIFDRIDRIGGQPTTVLGHPRVIDTPVGKAVEFNGVDVALFIDVHPLAGDETFT